MSSAKSPNTYTRKTRRRTAASAVGMNPTPANMRRFTAEVAREIKSASKSFTPAVNAKLRMMTVAPRYNILGCGVSTALGRTGASTAFKIRVGTTDNGYPICVDADSRQGQELLLKNFASSEAIDCKSLTMPAQRHANCWFNCMFATFFVSDKGRKFMRAFRQLMIEGKVLSGAKVQPQKLRHALLLFNMAIEACYGGPAGHDVAINTNNIIAAVYRAIPREYAGIKDIDAHGNPYYFYSDLLEYLNAGIKDAPRMVSYKYEDSVTAFFNGENNSNKPADIVVIQLTDTGAEERAQASDFVNKPLTVTTKRGYTYVLDSAVVRDITGTHFSACVHCNGDEYTYDGAVTSSLVKDIWTKRYNAREAWGITGSNLKWNFTDGYMLVFYYRVN